MDKILHKVRDGDLDGLDECARLRLTALAKKEENWMNDVLIELERSLAGYICWFEDADDRTSGGLIRIDGGESLVKVQWFVAIATEIVKIGVKLWINPLNGSCGD